MSRSILVEGKVLGKRRPIFTDWSVPIPPEMSEGSSPLTLRDLIACVVRAEVRAFQSRQTDQKLRQFLSPKAIADGIAKGKVTLGDRDFDQEVNPDEAVDVAILGFIDGLYFVFIDDEQQEDLEAPVSLQAQSRMTFIRLVALAGG